MRKFILPLVCAIVMTMTTSCSTIYQKIKYSNKNIEISNPCQDETIDFKLISLIGDKEEQTLVLNCRFINRDVNANIAVGGNLVCYDTEGVAHNTYSSRSYDARTDKKVNFSINIPGKVVPRKVKKLSVVSFDIGDCRITMKNVPIIWKKIEKENK